MKTASYVAVNSIQVDSDYVPRFEELFKSRAHEIDRVPGFQWMHVLKPTHSGEAYLVVSYWDDQTSFENWTTSREFLDGHRRAFADMAEYKRRGQDAPMKSKFHTYEVLCH